MNFSPFTAVLVAFIFAASFTNFAAHASTGDVSSNRTLGVVSSLNVSLRSEGGEDPGIVNTSNARANIWVNGKDYSPHKRGFNIAVFDGLSGRFIVSDVFDTHTGQSEKDRLETFLEDLPEDSIVLLAIQDDTVQSTPTFPTAALQSVGVQNSASIAYRSSHAVIGYKGTRSAPWKQEINKAESSGPSEVSAVIPISCAYVPQDSTTCSQLNVAAKKYGGMCLGQSSKDGANECTSVLDGTSSTGWLSSGEDVDAWIKIGFHTTFTINKLRIKQPSTTNQQPEEIYLEFSDCSSEKITLEGGMLDFQDFTFLSRQADWVKLTVKKVFSASNAVGIQDVEFHNDMCRQSALCDVLHVESGSQSARYRVVTTKFSFRIAATEEVHVLLTSESRASSPRYEITIGAYGNAKTHLTRYMDDSNYKLLIHNLSTPSILNENEEISFWIEIERDRVVFGSGEKVLLFWRDASPIKVKYVFFTSPKSSATVYMCARLDYCFKDASYYWPLDRLTNSKATIHGPGTIHEAPAKQGISPLALSLNGSESWVNLGDFKETCISDPSFCFDGFAASFKASVQGNGTGYVMSSGGQNSRGFCVFYVDDVMHFRVHDGEKAYQVEGSYRPNRWQTFALSWSKVNGLTAVIAGTSVNVLRDVTGKVVTPSSDSDTLLTLARPNHESANYAQGAIRDVAVWKKEITDEQITKLHTCNEPDTCPDGWQYFDGSCYKSVDSSNTSSEARASCLAQGGDLVKVSSPEENAFVSGLSQSKAWIGLEKASDSVYYWKDATKLSYSNWASGQAGSENCVDMDTDGTWSESDCSSNSDSHVCELAPQQYLGCYHDNSSSPTFSLRPGSYHGDSVTPGVCRQACGAAYFSFAALKQGHLCLCSNSTSPATESAPDMCFAPCYGAGDTKCGGDSHVTVYKSAKMAPASLTVSADASVGIFTEFNVTLSVSSPDYQIVESYAVDIADGSKYHTTRPFITHAFIYPGTYVVLGQAVIRHNDTGQRWSVQSSTTVTVETDVSKVEVICPEAAPTNSTFGCSVQFSPGAGLKGSISSSDGRAVSVLTPDADIMSVGIGSSDPAYESNDTTDGLYVMADMEAKSEGQLMAVEVDAKQGGFLDVKVYRPSCVDSSQRYCPATKTCVYLHLTCPSTSNKSCENDEVFSFSGSDCAKQDSSRCKNKAITLKNYDYKHLASFMIYTTSGPKRIVFKNESQRVNIEQGDVIAVHFPATEPAAVLKTSSSGSALFYPSSVVNSTGTQSLRGHRLPSTADSPQIISYFPAVSILYSAKSKSSLPISFADTGYEQVFVSVWNTLWSANSTHWIKLQHAVDGLGLTIPEGFPANETVNVTSVMSRGTNATNSWWFGDGSNATGVSSWVTHLYDTTGVQTVNLTVRNSVSVSTAWCRVTVQERIKNMTFKRDALRSIENGTTANICWQLPHGSHVEFSIDFGDGSQVVKNLTNMKIPSALFFACYKRNYSLPGIYWVKINAGNLINNFSISGNLSVQEAVSGVAMIHPGVVKTNETFNFTVPPHRGDDVLYTLRFMDGTTKNSSDRAIEHVFHEAGKYKVVLVASNDISSGTLRCEDVVVQDVIEGLEFKSFNHSVGVNSEASVRWQMTQGTSVSIHVDFGDDSSYVLNKSITVGDVLVAVSLHNYSNPGEYQVNITASNLVDSDSINTTVYVETPITSLDLAVARGGTVPSGTCTGVLYVSVNDTVTANAMVANGTNVHLLWDYGDGLNASVYSHRSFAVNGVATNHSYPKEGEYNITVTGSNRNPGNTTTACRVIVQYPIGELRLSSDAPRPFPNGTVELTVSTPGHPPTGPLSYQWVFGDNSSGESGDEAVIAHSYSKDGVYTVSVNVSNEISFGVASLVVEVQDTITGLSFAVRLTKYVNESSEAERANLDSFVPAQLSFPVEYDVLFEATITNGTSVIYIWDFGDGNNGNRTVENSYRYKFSSPGQYTVRVTAKNNVSSETTTRTIDVKDSIWEVTLTNDGPKEVDQTMTFTLKTEKSGTDSCYTIKLDNKIFHYYTGSPDPSGGCAGPTRTPITDSNSVTFTHRFGVRKNYPVKLHAENKVSRVVINDTNTRAVVVYGPCFNPVITVIGIGDSVENRTKFKKSQDISIITLNDIKCYKLDTEFKWTIESLDQTPLTQNITSKIITNRSTLNIHARSLPYGTYKLSFWMRMTAEEGVESSKEVYIEVVQSQLVGEIEDGMERTTAHNRTIVFDATKSYDPDTGDKFGSPDNDGRIYWFCMRLGDNYTLPDDVDNLPSLPTPPPITTNNGSVNFTNMGGCFGYGPGQLNYSGLEAKISFSTNLMTSGFTYIIRAIFKKGNRKEMFDQRVIVLPGDPPELSISCLQNCPGKTRKINPTSKFTLEAVGRCDSCRHGETIGYNWMVFECVNSTSCTKIPPAELKEHTSTPLDSSSLVIKPDFFKGGKLYKNTVEAWKSEVGGDPPKAHMTYEVKVNEPPKGGTCTVSPPRGIALETYFVLSCKNWKDEDDPLEYKFTYKTSAQAKAVSLGHGADPSRNMTLPPGSVDNDFNLTIEVQVSDGLGASVMKKIADVKVEKKKQDVKQLQEQATGQLNELVKAGNPREAAVLVTAYAEILNQPADTTDIGGDTTDTGGDTEKSKEDLKRIKEFREELVKVMVNIPISEETSLKDLAQLSGTIGQITAEPKENSEKAVKQANDFLQNAAAKLVSKATGPALSAEVLETCDAVFGGVVNVIRSAKAPSEKKEEDQSNTQESKKEQEKALNTVNQVTVAVSTSKLPGEESTVLETPAITLAVSREVPEKLANKTLTTAGSEVKLPSNLTSSSNASFLEEVFLVANTNLYAWGGGESLVNRSKQVSFSFFEQGNGSSRQELSIKNLTDDISIIVPRDAGEVNVQKTEDKMHKTTFKTHKFSIDNNASAIHVVVEPDVDVEVTMCCKRGVKPKPSEGDCDFNTTLPVDGFSLNVNSTNSTERPDYKFFLSNTMLNWTAAGSYYCSFRYNIPVNLSFPEEELEKLESVAYNFSVFTSTCLFWDKDDERWSGEGCKVGPNTNIKETQCLCTHLTTFASSFFVPPNAIDFDDLSVDKLLDSPLCLIAVCVVLGFYFLCLIPARRADKSDALKTGVTPLPDNDSRDTYCYEIHVHTGFVRGSGSSAEVSIVLTGALGDSEPRALKDQTRKIFKTGAVDAFLLTVPQSLGNLKQIRVWHNNEGGYPAWYLLRVMIQDIQTDQRWWFVCDDWLAVDESDGKIEKTVYPASKKDLTKFNVLFTSEVRKNLTDGHIWFSVVTRPSRSNFTRVQRLTCCLSILLSTMLANAMWYEVGNGETDTNSIKIVGFSFSIRQVSIGIMSSLVVFPANLIIVTLFRKAKPKENKYTMKTEGAVAEEVDEIDEIDIESGQQKSKQASKKELPHWFVYVAYVLAFLFTITSGSFVVIYGMQFGPEKSAQWLSSMTISFVQDVLFTQPIKVFILATLFALLIKDPKKAEENSYTDVNALANDEEWLQKNTEELDPEMQKKLKKMISDKPPDEAKLEIARQLRMKERQMKSIIREITWYAIFLLILLTIAYGNRDPMTSDVTNYMRNTFVKATYSGNLTYNKVHEIKDWWRWLNQTFVPSMYPATYYNNFTEYERGFLADTPTAWILGAARLRQLRIQKNSCNYKRVFYHLITECNDVYSIEEEEQGSYLPGWKAKRLVPRSNLTNHTPTPSPQPHVKGPWDYRTGSELKTFPYWGYKATYSAGGYVQELSTDNSALLLDTIGNLKSHNWLDRYTRAIFAEFTIYNANTNLFCVVTLLFEQLPTGSLVPYPSILTLRLFRYSGGEMYFVLACEIIYLLFCVYFVFREVRMVIKKGKEHLKNPWSILEILVTLLSLAVAVLYFMRLKFTKDALGDMRNNPDNFISFHYTAFLDEWLKCIMGLIVFFSFLKTFRLLRFNRRMSLLQQTIKRCAGNLLSFMIMFALAFMAFALLANLVFGQSMEGFGTFLRSCASLMDTILGKFTLKDMMGANRIIGPIFFYTYTVSMVFVLINMFLSIINDAFAEVRSDVNKQSNDYEIVDFMIHRLKENIGKSIGHAIRPEYKEPKTELECNFDRIADNADNAMHFMRNIAFEDMRKTRWFQTDNCTEKKRNLMKILMEVEWDYYEEELCDSIPVFEKFLNTMSNEDLERCLHHYREKRLVEDLAFERAKGSQSESSDGSQSDGDDSSDDGSDDDDNPSNDEKGSETELVADDGTRLTTPMVRSRAESFGSRRASDVGRLAETAEPRRVKSPALLVTDTEARKDPGRKSASKTSLQSNLESPASDDHELIKVLEDVERDVQSRCATDAELDSILYGDMHRTFDSDPATGQDKTNGVKKRRKKKVAEKKTEKNKKEAWVDTPEGKGDDDQSTGEPEEKRGKKKGKKAKKDAKLKKTVSDQENAGDDEGEDEDLKPKKKANKNKKGSPDGQVETARKENKNAKEESAASNAASENPEEAVAGENSEGIDKEQKMEEGQEKMKKKTKKKKQSPDERSETEGKEDIPADGKKRHKEKRKPQQLLAAEEGEDEVSSLNADATSKTTSEGKGKKKRKKKIPGEADGESEC